jgi:hypothetical protein
MIKQVFYTLIKGILPLLVYYIFCKLLAEKYDFLYFSTYKEIIGMSFYYSIGVVFFDLVIQIFVYYFVIKVGLLQKIPLFYQGAIMNIPLCFMWIMGFSTMDPPFWLIASVSFIISFIISGIIYWGLNKLEQLLVIIG